VASGGGHLCGASPPAGGYTFISQKILTERRASTIFSELQFDMWHWEKGQESI